MKRKIKRFAAALVAFVLAVAVSCTAVFAETYVVYNGYRFTKSTDGEVTIYEYLEEISELIIPEKISNMPVTAIGNNAFANRSDITSVAFPDTLSTIYAYAFENCASLENIQFTSSLSNIVTGTFRNCDSLTEVDLSVTKIAQAPAQLFYLCDNLKKVVLPESCTSIVDYSFADCPSLEYVYVPASVTSIGSYAFDESPNVVIYGNADSYAQQYAGECGIEFVAVDKYRPGDVDLDGYVNIKDVTLYQMYIVETSAFSKQQIYLADINGDGIYNISDATAIQYIIVNE